MITPIIAWLAVAALVAAVAVCDIIRTMNHRRHVVHHPLFEIGKERDEIWIPGDPKMGTDFDEFEDL